MSVSPPRVRVRAALGASLVLVTLLVTGSPAALASGRSGSAPTAGSIDNTGSTSANRGAATGSAGRVVTFGAQPASAGRATPRTYFDLLVNRGETTRDNLRVTNYSEQPLQLRVYASDASTAVDGGFVVASRGQDSRDVGSWVHIGGLSSGGTLRLAARTQVDLPLVLSVPVSAQPGDHGGALVVSYTSTDHDAKGNAVNVENRVATRVYARVSGVARAGVQVSELRTTYHHSWLPWARGRVGGSVLLRNTGNVRESLSSLITMSALFGLGRVSRPVGGPADVLPGSAVRLVLPEQRVRPLFREHVVVQTRATEVTVGPIGPAAVAATGGLSGSVTAIPWAALVLVLLLAGLVAAGWVGQGRRRRPSRGRHGGPGHGGGAPEVEPDLVPVAVGPSAIDLILPGHSEHPLAPGRPTPVGTRMGARRRTPGSSRRAQPAKRARSALGTAAAVAGLLGGAAALVAGAAPASAATTPSTARHLYFAPAVGRGITPAYVVTDGACPAASSNIVAMAYGHGFPASGQAVVSNSTAGVSHQSAFVLPLQDTMSSFAKVNHTTLRGTYRIVLTCTDRLQQHPGLRFVGDMRFSTPTHYVAAAPPVTVVKAVESAQSAADGSVDPQTIAPAAAAPTAGASGAASGTPTHRAGGSGSKSTGVPTLADGQPASQRLTETGGSGSSGLLGGAGLAGAALVVLGAAWLIRDHRRRTR